MRCCVVGSGRKRACASAPAALAAVGMALVACAVEAQADSQVEVAEAAPLAPKSLLLDIARAGRRMVAVGERGHVLLSDDEGSDWRQAREVPTRVLLTAVCFADGKRGVAVGHDEVILATGDAGETWKRTHYAPEAQQPLLDVWCGPDGEAIAVGAYGSYYSSTDGGSSWQARRLDARKSTSSQAAASDDAADERYPDEVAGDPHLNRVVAATANRFYIAGEAGHLYRSDDAGASWIELVSPYAGSFFGILPLDSQSLLAFGLRGHLYRSDDAGLSWKQIDTGTVAMLNDAVRVGAREVVIVGLSGTMLVSADGGSTFGAHHLETRKGLSAVMPAANGEVIAVGEGGVRTTLLAAGQAP